jgi:hypothetical protein
MKYILPEVVWLSLEEFEGDFIPPSTLDEPIMDAAAEARKAAVITTATDHARKPCAVSRK